MTAQGLRAINTASLRKERFVPGLGILVEDFEGLDWVHPAIEVIKTANIGLGLVALNPVSKGSTVILFGGKLMSWEEITALPEYMWDIPFQVSDDIFFGIQKPEEIGKGERINHSCEPNVGFASEMKLVAMKDILPGDPVTMDYATCSSMDGYYLACKCGATNCRGKVTGDDWKSPLLQEKLKGYFQPYLQEKIDRQRKGAKSRLASLFHRTKRF